eukprot:14017884-Alexandrium_andersonii.AAC.1
MLAILPQALLGRSRPQLAQWARWPSQRLGASRNSEPGVLEAGAGGAWICTTGGAPMCADSEPWRGQFGTATSQ